MLKLTRLNNHLIAINPDHIGWADAMPDTTLCMIGGEKIIIRETLEELIEKVLDYRRAIRLGTIDTANEPFGDPPRFSARPNTSDVPRRPSWIPRRGGL
jgi:flagellar protein FlbD